MHVAQEIQVSGYCQHDHDPYDSLKHGELIYLLSKEGHCYM
jgi:hypothetical protein